jgi:dTDP-4-dehydrorhamnose 3,5-epimerase
MLFHALPLIGAYLIESEAIEDERGFFARTWDKAEFEQRDLDSNLVQVNLSYNHRCGTLRGLHYQLPPHAESKLVRCIRGKIYDVIVDIRPQSPSFLQWYGAELSEDNLLELFVPKGFAHGFQTLVDSAMVHYQMSTFYAPAAGGGLRWNDPALAIDWPLPVTVIAARDASHPDLRETRSQLEQFRSGLPHWKADAL